MHHLMVYADVNFLDENINTIKKDIAYLLDASKETDLEVKTDLSICSCLITSMQGKSIE